MRIWELRFEVDTYDNLVPAKKWDIKIEKSFDGRSHLKKWKSIDVVRMEPEKELPLSDAPGFYSHIPVFNGRIVNTIKTDLDNCAEILPLNNEEDEYFAINITNVIDCIDYQKSDYLTFPDGKRILRFKTYCFRRERLAGQKIFKIKDKPLSAPFVTDEFKSKIETFDFTGFKFNLVWDSDKQ